MIRRGVLAAMLALAVTACGPSEADKDRIYLENLDEGGIAYTSSSEAIQLAKTICFIMDDGMSWIEAAQSLMVDGYSAENAGYIMGSATYVYCDEHARTTR